MKKLTEEQKKEAVKLKEELFVDLDTLLRGYSKRFKEAGYMEDEGYGSDDLWVKNGFAIIAIRRTEDVNKNESNQMVMMNPHVLKDSLKTIIERISDIPECTDLDCPGHGAENKKKVGKA